MKTENKIKLFLVDDDAFFLKSLEIEFLQHADFEIETFESGEKCIKNLETATHKPELVVLDYQLDGTNKDAMNGLQTLDKIKSIDREINVVMLSSQDKIEVAVSCMQHQALDYVVKSETAFIRLRKIISSVMQKQKTEKQLNWYMEKMQS
jgi:two-component system, OmpR family, response regulator